MARSIRNVLTGPRGAEIWPSTSSATSTSVAPMARRSAPTARWPFSWIRPASRRSERSIPQERGPNNVPSATSGSPSSISRRRARSSSSAPTRAAMNAPSSTATTSIRALSIPLPSSPKRNTAGAAGATTANASLSRPTDAISRSSTSTSKVARRPARKPTSSTRARAGSRSGALRPPTTDCSSAKRTPVSIRTSTFWTSTRVSSSTLPPTKARFATEARIGALRARHSTS